MSNFNWDSFFCVIFAYSYKHDKIVKKERMMMVKRCSWVDEKSEIYKNYHDHEWGVPVYDDEKLYELNEEYGPLGEAVYIRIINMIYKNGYYLKFNSLDNLSALLAKSIGSKWVRKNKVKEIILFLPQCQLLDQCLLTENVLTSERVQRGWLDVMNAMNRKIPEEKENWLL